MKMWHKILIAMGSGLFLGLALPLSGGDTHVVLKVLSDLLLALGTYILIPLIFAQVCLATYDLAAEPNGRHFALRTLLVLVLSTLIFALVGGLAVLVLPIDRIPVIVEVSTTKDIPGIDVILQNLFAPNALQLMTGPVQYVPGIFMFAVVFGLGLHIQRNSAKPVIDFLESVSRVFVALNRYFVEIMIWGSVILLSARIVAIRETPGLDLFLRLFLVLIGLGGFLICVVYPLVLRMFGLRTKPFAWFKQTLTPVLIGLSSGNNYLPLGAQIRNGLENLRYHRRIWGWFYPLASITGRAGTALVTSVSFFLVLRSYSSLEITIVQFVFVVIASVLVTLALGAIPNSRLLIGLALMSSWFGQGIEEGYLILQPVAPILVSIAVVLDTFNQSFIAYLLTSLSRKENSGSEKERSSKLQDEFNIS